MQIKRDLITLGKLQKLITRSWLSSANMRRARKLSRQISRDFKSNLKKKTKRSNSMTRV